MSQAADEALRPRAEPLDALVRGELADPFSILGPHTDARGTVVRAWLPGAQAVEWVGDYGAANLDRIHDDGLFAARLAGSARYRLRIHWPNGVQETEDPYTFDLLLGELDLHLIAEGRHLQLARCLGAQAMSVDGIPGVRFAVWAPNARRVSVVGPFNGWDGRRHPMRFRHEAGVWELFLPRLQAGELYKFEILDAQNARRLKADPVALRSEVPPGTASVVAAPDAHTWRDQEWQLSRARRQAPDAPMSIYEVHAGSWQRNDFGMGAPLSWDELAGRLVPYVAGLGFTHIELLPIMEHPFGGSWGYQPLAMFAPTGRYGPPEAFVRFVDACHAAGIGVILDWVPAHFPSDEHGLRRFDGTALYEHEDPREGFHQDWNTLIYNLGGREVRNFLIASALHWIEHYHIDGLRVDAVASMLYRDYSRRPGEWIPNVHGGRENLEATGFLRQLNETIAERCPGAITIAEESTSWPGVTRATAENGLDFHYKWNMGWMHDSLRYMRLDPVHRRHAHEDLSFGILYAFSERFVLPLSHDEVVHLKGSLIRKMHGDTWQAHANLRAWLAMMWTYPGKKLLFMGCELAQESEWNHDAQLEWQGLNEPLKRGVQAVVGDLNRLYSSERALHQRDIDPGGFQWLVADDRDHSVFAWLRWGSEDARPIVVVCNMTPVPRHGHRIGVPRAGAWRELLNTDATAYGGGNIGNQGAILAEPLASHGQRASLNLSLPPLATLVLAPEKT